MNGDLVSFDDGQCYVILEFVPGHPMAEEHLEDQIAADLGEFVARMHDALDGFVPRGSRPAADTGFIDAQLRALSALEDGYCGVKNIWPEIREHFADKSLPQGVVHADLYPGNVIVDQANRLRAVIDFDDCYWGTVLFDLAIVTMSFSFTGPCQPDWRRAVVVLDAYEAVRGPVDLQDLYLANEFAQRTEYLMDPTVRSQFFASRAR